jgi:hypothetical protein
MIKVPSGVLALWPSPPGHEMSGAADADGDAETVCVIVETITEDGLADGDALELGGGIGDELAEGIGEGLGEALEDDDGVVEGLGDELGGELGVLTGLRRSLAKEMEMNLL